VSNNVVSNIAVSNRAVSNNYVSNRDMPARGRPGKEAFGNIPRLPHPVPGVEGIDESSDTATITLPSWTLASLLGRPRQS